MMFFFFLTVGKEKDKFENYWKGNFRKVQPKYNNLGLTLNSLTTHFADPKKKKNLQIII